MDEYFQQHPIPQQISSYEFRLVGDMTIKQFFQVAGGALAALFFYSTSLPPYFKLPLILVSFLLGLALAFLPLQDRPLSQWILLFAKAIYSPTIFIWNRMVVQPTYFESDTPPAPQPPVTTRPDVKIPDPNVPKIPVHKEPDFPAKSVQPTIKTEQIKPIDQPPESVRLEKSETEFLSKVAEQFTAISPTLNTKTPIVFVAPSVSPEAKRQPVAIPQREAITVEKSSKPTLVAPPELKAPSEAYKISPIEGVKPENTKAAEFSSEATPPAPPSTPNVVVGQVIDPLGKIIEGAIIEIRDTDGRPVRALKTNRLGHFMIATPLTNGRYVLITEKEGLNFDQTEISASGQVIQPVAIRGKSAQTT